MIAIFVLLLIYQVKHFVADYPLQTPWMLGKFKDKGWVVPLAAHAAVHGLFTVAIGLFCGWIPLSVVLAMGLFDFVVHFTMDRIKASPNLLGRFKPLNGLEYAAMNAAATGNPIGSFYPVEEAKARLRSNRWFWLSIGLDQAVHHLTHYVVIAVYYYSLLP